MTTARRDLLLIVLVASLPTLLYVVAGYGGHDFSFHAASWLEIHQAWLHGEWRLGWANWAQFNFGEPRFCFYPPLSILLGAGLSFLLPFRLVPGVVVWLVLALAGLSMYRAAGVFLPRQQRLLAALLYMFNPYLLLTVILRYAIAEAWVQALLPLTFLYIYLGLTRREPRDIAWAALLLAINWLTNIPEAIGIFYAMNLVAAVLALWARSFRPLIVVAAAQALALLLAAFRLWPALREKSWIDSQNLLLYDFRSYMQLRRIPQPHLLPFLCGVYIVLALLVMVPALRQNLRHDKAWGAPAISLVVLASFSVLLQLPISTPIWVLVPQFKFVLFPYRLLPLLALAAITALCARGVSPRLRLAGIACFGLIALSPFFSFHRLLSFQRFHSIAQAEVQWEHGFEGVREYAPAGVPRDRADQDREPALARQGAFQDTGCAPSMVHNYPDEQLVSTRSTSPCTLILSTFYYPFWTATLDNGHALGVGRSAEGMLEAAVPAGEHQVRFAFVPASRTRTLSAVLSACVLLILLVALALDRRSRVPLPDLPASAW